MKIKKCFDFFLYSNIFISLCAAAFTIETYLLIHAKINWIYILFVFLSTLVLYNFPTFLEDNFAPEYSERHKWVSENKKPLSVISLIALLGVIVTIFSFPFKFILLFTPIAVIAFAYFFPQTQLRSITGLKTAIVAFVWTSVTGIFTLLLNFNFDFNNSFGNGRTEILLQNFFFIFPLCVIFNVRDIEADRNAGVKTFPVIYGVKKTILVCLISLLIFSTIVFFSNYDLKIIITLLLSCFVTAIFILLIPTEVNASPSLWEGFRMGYDYYYSFWIDGTILLQAGLMVLQNFF